MKMIYAIIQSADSNNVTELLNKEGFVVTKLATTGGFMRKGNTTLLVGTKEEHVQKVIEIIKKECGERKHVKYNLPYSENPSMISGMLVPVTVDVGGAVIFVVDVERFEKV
jgi:uncharacterized protein YaaQ